MNVHPDYFGRGVARLLLEDTCNRADRSEKQLRLVSSALNLYSFSLYTRAGVVPRAFYQDMLVEDVSSVLESTLDGQRPATLDDLAHVVSLEGDFSGIRREQDWRYFLTGGHGWRVTVCDSQGARNCELHMASVEVGRSSQRASWCRRSCRKQGDVAKV